MKDSEKEEREKLERQLAAGRNFKKALERAGLKQVDVMSKTGTSQGRVSNWAAKGVSAQFAPMVAQMLGVRPAQICAMIHEVVPSPDLQAQPARVDGSATVTRAETRAETRTEMVAEPRPSWPGEPERPPRLQQLVDTLDAAALGAVDLTLLEELVHRLDRPNRGGGS